MALSRMGGLFFFYEYIQQCKQSKFELIGYERSSIVNTVEEPVLINVIAGHGLATVRSPDSLSLSGMLRKKHTNLTPDMQTAT